MGKEKISNLDGMCLVFLVGMTNVFSVLAGRGAGRGVWICDLVALAVALCVLWLLVRCCDASGEESAYGVFLYSLGKRAAGVLAVVFILLSLLGFTVSLTVFSRFVQISALARTPQIIIPLAITLLCAFAAAKGLCRAAGASRLLFLLVLGVSILFVISSLYGMLPGLLLPHQKSFSPILKGAGEVFLNRFGQIPALVAIYTRLPKGRGRAKYVLWPFLLAGLMLAAISALTVATLGEGAAQRDFYPVYTAMSVRSVGGFVRHIEIFACIAMTLCLIFKGVVCIAFADELVCGLVGEEGVGAFVLPLSLICASGTQIIYKEATSLRGMLEWKSGAVVVLLVNILLPVVLWACAAIKNKKRN